MPILLEIKKSNLLLEIEDLNLFKNCNCNIGNCNKKDWGGL